jgi:hypothetical protein
MFRVFREKMERLERLLRQNARTQKPDPLFADQAFCLYIEV